MSISFIVSLFSFCLDVLSIGENGMLSTLNINVCGLMTFARNIRRRQLEADYEVAMAKGDMRQITLFARWASRAPPNDSAEPTTRLKTTRWWK